MSAVPTLLVAAWHSLTTSARPGRKRNRGRQGDRAPRVVLPMIARVQVLAGPRRRQPHGAWFGSERLQVRPRGSRKRAWHERHLSAQAAVNMGLELANPKTIDDAVTSAKTAWNYRPTSAVLALLAQTYVLPIGSTIALRCPFTPMAASAYTATPHQAPLRISTTSEDANSARPVDVFRGHLGSPLPFCGATGSGQCRPLAMIWIKPGSHFRAIPAG